ncbi:isochorismatase family protein [Bacillus timonensis]|uniref:Isochorismatase family protein n=1 Tax=Bacillus timonensis TaxID=1033734 RepID=A0A4S3PTX3_9BACI|nr:isochorismatase family protein [Bacillus timonensis]THE13078.1 isochorismatase family protein [Bacillus timonensis]
MQALLVIDVQNGIVNFKDSSEELTKIQHIIQDFKAKNLPVIMVRHFDKIEENPLHRNSSGSEIHESVRDFADYIVEKETPSAFFQTNLASILEELGVKHIFITGFETEFCCMFTAISGYDRGYKVTFIEDATGTTNSEDTYEMKGLDIKDFVGTVLNWSETTEVLYYDEYKETYQG